MGSDIPDFCPQGQSWTASVLGSGAPVREGRE
ncbi:hypothetical protein F0726_00192 [Acidithiobacillus caldus]|nr:hypothetical protein F0726_00192 [Acidithiobacillus caldus]